MIAADLRCGEKIVFAAIRGTRIYFDVDGMGLAPEGNAMVPHPTAFVIHGGPGGDHSAFKATFQPMTGQMQFVYFDHRGQGRSAKGDPERYTLDENVDDMEALRLHLGLGPIVSIGTSYGGMVAMAHAARYPHAVSHLVLCVTAAHGGFVPAAQAWIAAHGTPEQQAVCATLWAGGFTEVEQLKHYYDVMGPLYATSYNAEAAALTKGRGTNSPEPLNRAFGPGGFLRSFDLRPELARITAPTRILAGRHDWICPPQFSEEIHALIPGSTLRIFETASHSLRADVTDALRADIAAFVTGNGSPG
jgi:proline iminopeptidase